MFPNKKLRNFGAIAKRVRKCPHPLDTRFFAIYFFAFPRVSTTKLYLRCGDKCRHWEIFCWSLFVRVFSASFESSCAASVCSLECRRLRFCSTWGATAARVVYAGWDKRGAFYLRFFEVSSGCRFWLGIDPKNHVRPVHENHLTRWSKSHFSLFINYNGTEFEHDRSWKRNYYAWRSANYSWH